MNWKYAAIRGARTFFQALAGLMTGLGTAGTLVDIKMAATTIVPVVLWSSFIAGLVAFAQNMAEGSAAPSAVSVVVTNPVNDPVITEEAPKAKSRK